MGINAFIYMNLFIISGEKIGDPDENERLDALLEEVEYSQLMNRRRREVDMQPFRDNFLEPDFEVSSEEHLIFHGPKGMEKLWY